MNCKMILLAWAVLIVSCSTPLRSEKAEQPGRAFDVAVAWGEADARSARSLADDSSVDSVSIQVENNAGASIGSGSLSKVEGAWKGRITVTATGSAAFRATARASTGRLLYGGLQVQTLNGSTDSVAIAVQALSNLGGSIQGQELALSNSVSTFAGSKSTFYMPVGITSDGTNLYVAETSNHLIRKIVLATGVVSTLAGSAGEYGSTNATGPAARFFSPTGLATDGTNLYVADYSNSRVRQIVLATGVVTTLAGTTGGNLDGPGTTAKFGTPKGLVLVGSTLYVSDSTNHNIRAIDLSSKAVTTVAGSTDPNSPQSGTADDTGPAAQFSAPSGMTTDGTDLYIADTGNHRIRKIVLSSGTVTTVAGSSQGYVNNTGTAAQFSSPGGLATDGTFLYVADTGNHKIRKIALTGGAVTVFAGGNGSGGSSTVSGDRDGTGTAAGFSTPRDIVFANSSLYLTDWSNNKIRKITTGAVVTTVAGTGASGSIDGPGLPTFDRLVYLTTDGTDLFATDWGNHTIQRINLATGTVTVFAGTRGSAGSVDGTGTAARFNQPHGITTDGTYLYVADTNNHVIRRISIAGAEVTTLAGLAGSAGLANDQGSAARFANPLGITTDGTSLFVTETTYRAVRQISISTRDVTTLAGGVSTDAYLDGPGAAARFRFPSGITTDGVNLYVTDASSHTIRQITIADGVVTTIAGADQGIGSTNAVGSAARFDFPLGITTDGSSLYVADTDNHTVRKIVLATGDTSTLAGWWASELDGIGTEARFNNPIGITTDGMNLYVNDAANHTIRKIR